MASRLLNRNFTALARRTSMRLEPELWQALDEICARERTTLTALIQSIERSHGAHGGQGGRTSAVRVHLLAYFRAAATEEGHLLAGHGRLGRPSIRAAC